MAVRSYNGRDILAGLNTNFENSPGNTILTGGGGKWLDGTAGGAVTNAAGFNWHAFLSGTSRAQFDNTVYFSGSNSFKISTLAVSSYVEARHLGINYNTAITEGFPLKPLTQYRMTYKMKTNLVSGTSNDGARLQILEATATGINNNGGPAFSWVKTTTDWTEYTGTFTTKVGTTRGHIELRLYGHTGAGTLIMDAWFDDISLTEVLPARTTISRPRVSARFMGGSTQFNGTTSTIPTTLTDNSVFTSGFVLHGWIKPRSQGETAGRIFDKCESTSGLNGLATFVGSTRLLGLQVNAGTTVSSNPLPSWSTWVHWVCHVSADATVSHYVNGVLSGTPAATGALSGITTGNPLTIGNRSGATDRTFDGNLAELGIISLAGRGDLTADEITNLYTNSIKPTGASNFWELDEQPSTYTDSIGGATGTGTATTYSPDTPVQQRVAVRDMGTALRFDGSSDFVTMTTALMPTTISFVATVENFDTSYFFNAVPDNDIGVSVTGFWKLYDGANRTSAIRATQAPQFMTFVYTGTGYQIYVNGVYREFVTSGQVTINTIGRSVKTPKGVIDEPLIWNRALTAQEIANMYFNNVVPRDGLVAEYLFNEALGPTALDTSGNGNDGTITGATYTLDVPLTERDDV